MDNNEQFTCKRFTHGDVTLFAQRMLGIRDCERQRIAENSSSLLKADTVFGEIRSRLRTSHSNVSGIGRLQPLNNQLSTIH
jgi:hypothetical protein